MQQYFYELIGRRKGAKRRKHFHHLHRSNGLVLLRQWGFELSVRPSLLGEEAGLGVFVSRGSVPAGATAALYPGTVYEPGQPVLLQSVANQYILRCSDGIMVDGNNRGVSRMVFSSSINIRRSPSNWARRQANGRVLPLLKVSRRRCTTVTSAW